MPDPYMDTGQPAGSGPDPQAIDPLDILIRSALTQGTKSDEPNSNSLNITLSIEEQSQKMNSIADIFQLEEDEVNEDQEMLDEGEEDAEPVIDLEDQRRRTERLRGAMSALAQLWWADSDQMDIAVEKLADGSREPKWRIPIGESGILNFVLELFGTQTLKNALKIHILRVIGNSCADTDENRARVVASNYFPSIILQLQDTSLLPFAVPVLYNICIDYEPAQTLASECFLTKELIDLISSPRFHDAKAFLGYICKIIDLMVTQPSELELAPAETPRILLKVAADRETPVDMDDFISLTNTAISYLQHERFQKDLIEQGALDATLAVLVDSYTRFDSHPSIGVASGDQDDAKALSNMRSNFNQVLSDISALPEFQQAVPVVSPFTASLRRWLLSPQLQLQVCACIILGNLARSDEACIQFVHTSGVHIPLVTILKDATDSQLLHAAIGFLKNLAMPPKNKEIIGSTGIFKILPRLWALDTMQQIQFSAISLARQLTIGTFMNVRELAKRLNEDEDSPAHYRTNISLLIALFDRTDVEPIKMEISRLITSVCRVTNSTKARTPEQLVVIRHKFFTMHPDIGRPLGFMVSQTKWPVVRSEGWFVFALMARYPEGAQCISDLMHDVAVFAPLVEMLTGKRLVDYQPTSPRSETTSPASSSNQPSPFNFESKSPESVQPDARAEEMARIDRENALVLINELLKNRGSDMALMRRTLFEDLLKGGSEIVSSYKESKPNWSTDVKPKEKRIRADLNMTQVAEQSSMELS
ncbi:ARM repeat-containing protein [Mollisia scopiformis]|uniref:ARM repeat-containing protein n=1 Tax=Mollisia scopiformis TaxID=149040 RepID=A0A194XLS5_MOLSC|nr:ARM repeat-containing protein [Mollisia scopiformis]KUJ20717.1 ARM repeat-containing protein [Mollisia scopiformis]